ncbi:glycosyltransferase [Pelagicoccus sp. SDUM812003]|uniref:glycosyltransferase n=1 Tax=Pelagicoccus sp. SDUM812003 TaxID=3041267 RepID=UPI00280E0AC2|nr:glycosyltransferase [Pelagicoccus sp. SDUM812003]MDQ8203455.1 glycosyltransferase [Pelagicoccus sp. SDUM812003]
MASSLKPHFDEAASKDAKPRRIQKTFHQQIAELLRFRILSDSSILEVGCGKGDLLPQLSPARGLGIDFSEEMIAAAKARHEDANLHFSVADAAHFNPGEAFDHIVLDYLLGYIDDIQSCLENLLKSAGPRTRLHITSLNTVWRPALSIGQKLGWVSKQPPSNWLSTQDIVNLLEISGWEVVSKSCEILLPFQIPIISPLLNRFAARLPLLRHLGSTLLITARPQTSVARPWNLSCSVIVPARNEAGNIRPALERIPSLGSETEVIFIEGNSKDNTWETIQSEASRYQGPHTIRSARQPGKGKWDAVRLGFEMAKGDVLVIQDGDLTAPPEDLPKFFNAIADGTCEFANGSRLVYPMESRAMRFLNLLGNKFFAITLSFLLGQNVKDSLCGTKMMLRQDYEKLKRRIESFGDFDPFGDFNLLFGSALLHLKIRDIPVRYRDRLYGDTNISRFRHGFILLQMAWFGLRKIKFAGFSKERQPEEVKGQS